MIVIIMKVATKAAVNNLVRNPFYERRQIGEIKMVSFPRRYIVMRGITHGAMAALIGSSIFAISVAIALIVQNGINDVGDFFFQGIAIVFVGGTILGFPFSAVGSVILALDLCKYYERGEIKVRKAIARGAVLGFEIGVGVFLVATVLYLRRSDFMILVFYGCFGIILCTFIGGATGRALMRDFHKYAVSSGADG